MLEEYPTRTIGIHFLRAAIFCETSYIPDPQEIHEAQRQHQGPKEKSASLESKSKPAV